MQKELIDKNPILKTTIEFSISIIEFCEKLNEQRQYIISNQLLRSGTSIGANSIEAQNAESKADFIHKLKIAAKEADETQYWLIICERSKLNINTEFLQNKLTEIQKILNAILGSAKRKSPLTYFFSFLFY